MSYSRPFSARALALAFASLLAASFLGARPLRAVAADEPASSVPQERTVVTQHSAQIDGKLVRYHATAGTLLLYDAKGQATASVFYHAYVADGLGASATRPITFSYNGGPGGSSAFVDIGGFGPRTVVIANADQTAPPYRMADNENSILDRTDLVFVDAVGTGFSRVVGHGTGKDYYGVDEDGKAFAQFIRRYITRNDRWNSPKYLLGESYGTTRSAVLAKMLEDEGIAVSGVTLMSTVLDFATLGGGDADDQPYVDFLPTETAVAAYHHRLPAQPADLDAFLREARTFAAGPFARALSAGDSLPDADRRAIAQQLHAYTGLPVDYILQANLRVQPQRFRKALLGDRGETVGRYDGRYRGFDIDPPGADADGDPTNDAITGAFTAAFNAYVRGELAFKTNEEYRFLSGDVNGAWNWSRGQSSPAALDVVDDLARAMVTDRFLRVLSVNGIYDMATPFFGTERALHHLGIAPELQKNVSFRYYPSGHMIYVNPAAHASLRRDLDAFYDEGPH